MEIVRLKSPFGLKTEHIEHTYSEKVIIRNGIAEVSSDKKSVIQTLMAKGYKIIESDFKNKTEMSAPAIALMDAVCKVPEPTELDLKIEEKIAQEIFKA